MADRRAPDQGARRRGGIRRGLLLVAAVLVATLVAACGGGGEAIDEIDFAFAEPDTLAAPELFTVTDDTAWFLVDGSLVAVDAESRQVDEPIVLPTFTEGIAADENAVWIAFDDDTVRRVDAATGEVGEPIRVAPEPEFSVDAAIRGPMAVTDRHVWVALREGIARIDVETRQALPDDLPMPDVSDLVVDGDTMWAGASGRLVRLDATTGEVTGEVEVGAFGGDLAVRDGTVWMRTEDTITIFDGETLDVVGEPIEYGEDEAPRSLTAGRDALWGTRREANRVLRIDDENGEITDEYELSSPYSSNGAELAGVKFGAGALWVGTAIGNRAGVIDPP